MMDRYTKTILTVIALALVWLSIRDLAGPTSVAAMQNQSPTLVSVTGFTPDALGQLSVFDPSHTGRRGVPVILVNPQDVKLTPPAPVPPR